MKRSKLFLGITAGLLAFVAFKSAKAKFISLETGYITAHGVVCFDNGVKEAQTALNGLQLVTLKPGNHSYKLYTFAQGCITPVYTED